MARTNFVGELVLSLGLVLALHSVGAAAFGAGNIGRTLRSSMVLV